MQPLRLEGAKNYGAPPDWSEERDGACLALPVIENGSIKCSVWAFSPEERELIAKGYNIALTVVGGQPPVSLSVHDIRGVGAWDDTPTEPAEPVKRRSLYMRLFHCLGLGWHRSDEHGAYCVDCHAVLR